MTQKKGRGANKKFQVNLSQMYNIFYIPYVHSDSIDDISRTVSFFFQVRRILTFRLTEKRSKSFFFYFFKLNSAFC